MQERNIRSAVINELQRICLFVLYYLLLIVIGIVICVGAFWSSFHLIIDVLPHISSARGIIAILALVVGLCLFAIMLGVYLIKPLFAFKKNRNEARVEISESECPALFAMIRDVATNTGCKMPKHVYLTPDVNACVFYNTSFWSIFFPIRKNLEIGLGLFDHTSVDEVKSVIAHEFGHFSQKSMKVGSTVYVTNTVLHNLIYAEDFWGKFLDKCCLSDYGVIRFFGELTRALTNLIKRLTFYVYKFVQKGYLQLSRYMEYDADNISCQYVGSSNFISAMCKIDALAKKDALYQHLLSSLVNDGKIVSNYFNAKQIFYKTLSVEDMLLLSYDVLISSPIRTFDIKSRVKVDDIWTSHPDIDDRIKNAELNECEIKTERESIASWTLIPSSISDKVSENYISLINKGVKEPVSIISDAEFEQWLKNTIKEDFMDKRLNPFFGNIMIEFDVDNATKIPSENPLNDDNALKVAKYSSYINDWRILNQVKDGQIEVKEVLFDNKIYPKKYLPIKNLEIELDILRIEVTKIYSNIYAYISSLCSEEKKSLFRLGFVAIFYARNIRNQILPELFFHRDNLYRELSKSTRRDEDEYNKLCGYVRDYEKHLKKVISSFDLEWMAHTFVSEEYIKELIKYTSEEHNSRFSICIDDVNEMFQITGSLGETVDAIETSALRLINDIAKEQLDAQMN